MVIVWPDDFSTTDWYEPINLILIWTSTNNDVSLSLSVIFVDQVIISFTILRNHEINLMREIARGEAFLTLNIK